MSYWIHDLVTIKKKDMIVMIIKKINIDMKKKTMTTTTKNTT
jgi:hypothetical protein